MQHHSCFNSNICSSDKFQIRFVWYETWFISFQPFCLKPHLDFPAVVMRHAIVFFCIALVLIYLICFIFTKYYHSEVTCHIYLFIEKKLMNLYRLRVISKYEWINWSHIGFRKYFKVIHLAYWYRFWRRWIWKIIMRSLPLYTDVVLAGLVHLSPHQNDLHGNFLLTCVHNHQW